MTNPNIGSIIYMNFGGVIEMKKYLEPEIEVVAIAASDILLESDTIVDIGGLYGEEGGPQMVSEYTGEPVEW